MAQPLALEMEEGTGELLIRDAEEPYLLGSPSTVSGQIDDTTGEITGLDLATPDISFEQQLESFGVTAYVDVAFSPMTPASGTGLLSPDGSLHLETALRVDLHIEVPQAGVTADCVASPVHLALDSTEPYDETTGVVPMADADLTIPSVGVTTSCTDLVAGQLNTLLAGAGHSLELTLQGEMTIPTAGETPSATTLTADPSGPVSLGQAVELTATVASGDPQVTDVPTGNVRFLAGGKVLALAPVEAGTAVASISTLRLGQHQITAEYRGDDTYKPSTSTPVAVTVRADPVVEADLPSSITIGGAPAEFDVLVDNPSVGRAVHNARVGITIERLSSYAVLADPLTPQRVLLEVQGPGDVWTPVTLTQVPDSSTPTLTGSLGPLAGRALAAGATLTDRVRLSFPNASPQTVIGGIGVTFAVAEVDPGSGALEQGLSSTTGRLDLFLAGRIPSEIYLDDFFAEIRPVPVRQHGTIGTMVSLGPRQGQATYPTGTVAVAIDGQSVPLFATAPGDLSQPNQMSAVFPEGQGSNVLTIPLPDWVGPGSRTITFSYSGDAQFAPTSKTLAITVIEPVAGTLYQCEMAILKDNRRFTAQLRASGRLPSTARSGTNVSISDFALELVGSINVATYYGFDILVREGEPEIAVDIGPEGTGSAPAMTLTPGEFPIFDAPATPDATLSLTDPQAAVTVSGAPGEVVVPTIERVTLRTVNSLGIPQEMTCVPVGEPFAFGSVIVAGTTLVVGAPGVVRADDEVVLSASVFPSSASGTVRFSSGDELLDIVAVSGGKAVSTVQLPPGEHVVTARFFAGVSAPSTTSEPVVVTVLPATECEEFAEEGNGAIVRLVYMELLGRCPDRAGFDHWTGALDGGTSPEVFARAIARTREAVGRVVDDAYVAMLGRAPDPAGRSYWVGRLQASGRYDSLLADLGASGEFWSKAGATNSGFVTRVYDRLLHRAPDSGGLAYWTGRLDAGTSRRALILALAVLDEPLRRLVDASYDEILSRAPGSSERANGIAFLRRTGDRSGLYAQLMGRPEFATRAGTFPNPED